MASRYTVKGAEILGTPEGRAAAIPPDDALRQPERRLMLAVLRDALATFERYAAAWDSSGRRRFEETATWFASDDVVWPFSFRNVCEELGIDADSVRARLQRWRRHRLAEGEVWRPGPGLLPERVPF
jgi:hypothetical protein